MSQGKRYTDFFGTFLRYARNRMHGKERNAFERRLQKDPFEAEAAEGLSMIRPEEAEEDIRMLQGRIKRMTTSARPLRFQRVAAILVLLLATAALITIVSTDRKQPLVSENLKDRNEVTVLNISEASPLRRNTSASPATRAGEAINAPGISDDKILQGYDTMMIAMAEAGLEENRGREETKALKRDASATTTGAIAARAAENRSLPGKITGIVISSDDNQPLAGVSINMPGKTYGTISDINGRFVINTGTDSSSRLIASFIGMETMEVSATAGSDLIITMNSDNVSLDEVVVTAYSVSKKKEATGSVSTVISEEESQPPEQYISAFPVTGDSEFRKYIMENLRYPVGGNLSRREVVIVSMTVRTDGSLDSLEVIKSPGALYSEEALRIIREGPAWAPATLNGNPVEEVVRVRIVFRPQ